MQPTASDFSKDRPHAPPTPIAQVTFLAWPGWPHLCFASLLSVLNAVLFTFVYGGCDWLTAHRSLRVPIHLAIELSIPFIPGAVVVYMSIYVLFLAGPFIVRERREFAGLIRALALATLIGGVGFLFLPSRPAFSPPGELGVWTGLFHFADRLNLDYNMVPSLHVALSACCIAGFARHASPPGRALLWTWATAIALSTLFTHQHHVVDVVSGWGVGILAYRVAALRVGRWRASEEGRIPH
jgi:membrane-associated phospholipid phosphatase